MENQNQASAGAAESPGATAPALEQLERQMERGYLFAHSALGESSLRLGETQVILHGLIDTLLAKRIVTEEELAGATDTVRSELADRGELKGARTLVRADPASTESKATVQVDCRARMHVCHGVCCKLNFALSIAEVEAGKVKWDLGRPYFIRHDNHGGCTHFDSASGACRNYADRPGVCRSYSCAGDSRIWKNFERMEPNTEWSEANLSVTAEPRLVHAFMHGPERLTKVIDADQESAAKGVGARPLPPRHHYWDEIPVTSNTQETQLKL